MSEVVKANGLTKSYGDFKALDDVNFTIEKGSIVGLIGPNGAGKTSTLKSILGLTEFDGELEVLGTDPRKGRHHVMERVCFIADVGVLPRWLKVSEALDYIEGVHAGFSREKAETMLAETNISPKQRVKQLSKGMVTQLHLALILSISVDLLVLDEPTLGLDILYRKAFYDQLLNDYFDHETSIIISTHQVEEIETLLSHLLFIDQGNIVLDSPMDNLADSFCEVIVKPELTDRARGLNPIHIRESLGQKSMIFENVDRSYLAPLGELQVPSVADLFVAKLQRAAR
ncbi:ABC transporter ATP-binding protein [Pseudomonadales bacterium]|jgi:ABC-2 type transport system ATP-binding protein|nr:ABC transporter ATP-binding protein [Gammaproteobacteria bacterium]MDC1478094.1 ABC transporter ATP-binding protein [Pseudomonadales bacterium]MBT3709812.1 ABC transporter ATP-binding protein [Gammaproteobacteria bacterium]MBT3735713.1 ABC transporter ATP-binding protein [Gammaproteobacteria bacterium]MBT3899357.1 ABC transporter ATP-binding protein [Gammaproteobacteria bacterium]